MLRCFSLSAALLWSACSISAASAAPSLGSVDAVVDSVQMPAWLERQGVQQPLAPGVKLQSNDRILTGGDARVLIQLPDGSAVKLGENAQFALNTIGRNENRVFTAAIDVLKGAFRFTTSVFGKTHQQRDVSVRIATITAGIRGTDLWGSSDEARDLVCLLEGKISVSHAQDATREMTEPLSFYVVPHGQAPQPISKVDVAQVAIWAAQTEVTKGSGYAHRGGKWQVILASFNTQDEALALYDRARTAGYAVRIAPQGKGNAKRYLVRLTQLPSKAEAEVLSSKLASALKLNAPLVKQG